MKTKFDLVESPHELKINQNYILIDKTKSLDKLFREKKNTIYFDFDKMDDNEIDDTNIIKLMKINEKDNPDDNEYIFYEPHYIQEDDEEFSNDIDNDKFDMVILANSENTKRLTWKKPREPTLYYIFHCHYTPDETALKPIEPSEMKEGKTYLLHSCLHNHTVILKNIEEKDMEVEYPDNIIEYTVYKYSFTKKSSTSSSSSNDLYSELEMYAYEQPHADGITLKWKNHNIYKVFQPQTLKIMKRMISDRHPAFGVVKRHISEYIGGKTRKTHKRKRSTKKRKL